MRRSPIAAGTLLWALALLGTGCGGDTDILLQLGDFTCPTVQGALGSLELIVASQSQDVPGNPPALHPMPEFGECFTSVAFNARAMAQVFIDRGYVARGVSAENTTVVLLHARCAGGCGTRDPLCLCLISDPIPPNGQKTHLLMTPVCPPPPQNPVPSAEWQRCTSVLQAP
jgi:hypothetical protein